MRAARQVTSGALSPSDVTDWLPASVSRLLEHVYDIIRLRMMSGDQDQLRNAVAAFRSFIVAFDFDDDSYESVRCTALRALSMRNERKYESAKILSQEVLRPARDNNWNDLAYDALITLGDVAVQQGAASEARNRYDEALAVAERRSDETGAARALLNRSALDQASGRPNDAARYGKLAFQRFLEAGASGLAGWALIQESQAHGILGNHREAFETADRARNLFEVMHSMHGLGVALYHVGLSYHLQTDLASARTAYQRSLQVFGEHDIGDADTAEIFLAILTLELGNLAGAEETLLELAQRMSDSGRLPHLFVIHSALVAHAAMAGDDAGVSDHLVKTRDLAERTGFYELMVVRTLELAARKVTDDTLAAEIREVIGSQKRGLLGDVADPD